MCQSPSLVAKRTPEQRGRIRASTWQTESAARTKVQETGWVARNSRIYVPRLKALNATLQVQRREIIFLTGTPSKDLKKVTLIPAG